MSHNAIYQLSTEKLTEEEYIGESAFYEDFVGSVADHVNENVDRQELINSFVAYLKRYDVSYDAKDESITFPANFKDKFFEEKFNKFKELSSKITFEKFKDGYEIYQITRALDDVFDIYIYMDSYETISSFARSTMLENIKFYIGGVIDYHF